VKNSINAVSCQTSKSKQILIVINQLEVSLHCIEASVVILAGMQSP